MTLRPVPADGVFATAVLSDTRMLAQFHWARYEHVGVPLLLCDYDVSPVTADTWPQMIARLDRVQSERLGQRNLGVMVESPILQRQIHDATGAAAYVVPAHLVTDASWHVLCQSAAMILSRKDVGYTPRAAEKMEGRPFLTESAVRAGPRTDDPATAAFLYGVVLALDPEVHKDPVSRPPRPSRRN